LRLHQLSLAAVCAGAAAGAYARFVEPSRLETVRLDLHVDSWPDGLNGIRLGVVGDLHVGARRGRPWPSPALESAIAAIRDASVDLLLLVGDYGYMQWDAEDLAAIVGRFDAPVRVAVLGNHDFGRGGKRAAALRLELERQGIQVLVNEVTEVDVEGHSLSVAGLGDLHAQRVDVEAMVSGIPENRGPLILLSHSPDAVARVPSDAFDVAFSGHTHGAQVALPFLRNRTLRRFAHTAYDRGLYDVNGHRLYVTKGVGMVGYHARFRARPEVVIATVAQPSDGAAG